MSQKFSHSIVSATLSLAFLVSAEATSAQTYQVTVERNVPAKMRDGTILCADVDRPKAEGKLPVLLTRTPYDKTGGARIRAESSSARLRRDRARYPRPFRIRGRSCIPSNTNRRMATTPSNGLLRCHIRTAKSACSAARTLSAPLSTSRPSRIRRTRREIRRRHRPELPRRLDLPGRRLRVTVQRILDQPALCP